MNLEKIVGIHDRMPEAAHFPLDSGAAQLMQLREFPKACQTPALRPALPQQYLSVLLNGYQLFLQAYGFHTPGSDRKLRFASGLPRLALLSQRAKGTLRLFRQAYHGAQLHQGLIEFSRALGVEESIRQLTKPLPYRTRADISLLGAKTAEHANRVSVQHGMRQIERHTRDRRRGVFAYTG